MKEESVRVGIMKGDEISFELHGEFEIYGAPKVFRGNYIAKWNSNQIEILDKNILIYNGIEVELIPATAADSFFVLKNVTIGIDFHWEQKEDQRFKGSLKFIAENNTLVAINTLPVEQYLISVISSEMSATSSLELLKAHSVISRSWLIAQINKSREVGSSSETYQSDFKSEDEIVKWYDREDHLLFDVCADDHCQRYQGITKASTREAEESVLQTKGMVLTYEDKICDTRFSKSCGGISEAFENVWEPVIHPYLSKVVDHDTEVKEYDLNLTSEPAAEKWIRSDPPAFCNTSDKRILSQVLLDYDQKTTDFYRWNIRYAQDEIKILIEKKSGIKFGHIVDLIPVERGVSGRITKLQIVGTERSLTIGKELEIRKTLSPSHLYSSAFVVDKENIVKGIPQQFTLTGAGWGHGVGLCQIGAAVMGDKGYSYEDILLHYFKGARISKQY